MCVGGNNMIYYQRELLNIKRTVLACIELLSIGERTRRGGYESDMYLSQKVIHDMFEIYNLSNQTLTPFQYVGLQ